MALTEGTEFFRPILEWLCSGEVIALDDEGRPSFNALQNYGSVAAPVIYYVFDVMVLAARDVMREPLEKRRELLEEKVLPKLEEPVRYASSLAAALRVLMQSVKEQGFERLVAKRRNSVYESGLRTGAWMKMRVNRGQKFVIDGYTRGTKTFDALIFGYYEGEKMIYVARTRNGFTPVTRAQLQEVQGTRDQGVPVCKSARGEERSMGSGADESEDGGMPVAEAGARRPVRVSRVDRRQPLEALKVRWPTWGQEAERCRPGMTIVQLGFAQMRDNHS
jgi:ATP-dependent DNA ligase